MTKMHHCCQFGETLLYQSPVLVSLPSRRSKCILLAGDLVAAFPDCREVWRDNLPTPLNGNARAHGTDVYQCVRVHGPSITATVRSYADPLDARSAARENPRGLGGYWRLVYVP